VAEPEKGVPIIRTQGRRPHLIYASSGGGVYGRAVEGRPFMETDVCDPESPYGIQKLAAEKYIRLWAEKGHLSASVLRISNPYGIPLPPDRLQSFIGVAIEKIRQGKPVRVFGNLDNVRDYVHLSDVQNAFHRALALRPGFEIFNIGSGAGTSVRGLLGLFGELLERPVEVEHVEQAGAAQLSSWSVLDVSKAERILGWKPTIGLLDGLRSLFVSQSAPAPVREEVRR
jgi:UDP-glucose 4-epimerase